MHCPSCGQQQVSSETKFCSRCGMPLTTVAEVVANGGYLPQLAELNKKKRSILTRRNGLGFSLIWLLFFLLIATPFWGIMNVEELAGISAITGVVGALIMAVSSLIFLQKAPKQLHFDQGAFLPPGHRANEPQTDYRALPGQQSIPVSAYAAPKAGNWRDTNDLDPASVTENTTRLLDKDEAER
ncbi:MAG: hypothetical protein AB7J13_04065 [Pyrinomonadaceae bacterium]